MLNNCRNISIKFVIIVRRKQCSALYLSPRMKRHRISVISSSEKSAKYYMIWPKRVIRHFSEYLTDKFRIRFIRLILVISSNGFHHWTLGTYLNYFKLLKNFKTDVIHDKQMTRKSGNFLVL